LTIVFAIFLGNLALAIVVVFALWPGPAILAGWIASRKGRPFWLYLAAGMLLGPIALIASALLPRRRFLA
jgi:hypothetical protein